MIIVDCEQGTPEWHAARCGVITASNFDKIITVAGKPSNQAEKYLYKLAGESISGKVEEGFKSAAMQRGNDLEQEAREYYEFITDTPAKQIGFCRVEGLPVGCSPDGLVGDDGLLEIKCPSAAVHVSYLLEGALPTEYYQQVMGQLYVTGRKWCDFISYYPGIKPLLLRIEPVNNFLKLLEQELKVSSERLVEIIKKIRS